MAFKKKSFDLSGKVAVVIGFVVLLAISLLNSRKEATKA